ncbi:MAG: N-acetylneuraminate synthase family protein [Phycisphaerales bacterium JB038]
MRIGAREIGPGQPPYIIAEIGVNHDGEVDRAVELVHACAEAGAAAVKLQLFSADMLLSQAARLARYQKETGATDPRTMLRNLELSSARMQPIVEAAHRAGVHAIVSIFSLELVEGAVKQGWDALKTASPDIVHHPLLQAMAQAGKPMIVSTGAAEEAEVEAALACLPSVSQLALLHCVSAYPTPIGEAQLGGIAALARLAQRVCPEKAVVIGYSDHTAAVLTGALAVAAGAHLLEKHVTYDREASGPDHRASLEPRDLAEYVRRAQQAQQAVGSLSKHVSDIEQDVREKSRQSITSTRALKKGETLQRADVTFKRPGTGIPPCDLTQALGRGLRREVEADAPIGWEDLEETRRTGSDG